MSQLFSPSLSSLASRLCFDSSVTCTAVVGGCGTRPCLPFAGVFEVEIVEFSAACCCCCCFLANKLRTSCTSASLMAMRVGFRRIMERCLSLSKVGERAVVELSWPQQQPKTLRRRSQIGLNTPFLSFITTEEKNDANRNTTEHFQTNPTNTMETAMRAVDTIKSFRVRMGPSELWHLD